MTDLDRPSGEGMRTTDTAVVIDTPLDSVQSQGPQEPDTLFTFHEPKEVSPLAKKILCLDLTSDCFKFSIFHKSGKSVRWLMAGRIPDVEVDPASVEETVSKGIEKLSLDISPKSAKVLVIIPGSDFFLRRVEVPTLKGNDFLEAVKWECSKQVPYSIEVAYVNIQNVERVKNRLVVHTGIIVKQHVDAFAFLGERLLGVVPSPLGLYGSMRDLTTPRDITNILISWGESEGVIAFAHSGQFEFCKCFGIEGLVKDKRLLDPAEVLDRAERNLRNSLDFYNAHFRGRQHGEIKVHGPGSEALLEELSKVVGAEVGRQNPYADLIPDPEASSSLWENCENDYILCSGAVKLKPESYFLPVSVKQLLSFKKIKSISRALSLSAIIALLLLAGALWVEHAYRARMINLIGQEITEMESSPGAVNALSLKEELDAKLSLKLKMRPSQPWAANVLKGVSISVPPEISFKNMDLKKKPFSVDSADIRIEGFYYGNIEGTEVCLAELVENLRNYIGFEQERLNRMSERLEGDNKHSNFALTGQIGLD